jgi:hypothetical protein
MMQFDLQDYIVDAVADKICDLIGEWLSDLEAHLDSIFCPDLSRQILSAVGERLSDIAEGLKNYAQHYKDKLSPVQR